MIPPKKPPSRERIDSSICEPMRQRPTTVLKAEAHAIAMDPEGARLIFDRMLARRKGSEAEWLFGLIDSDFEAFGECSCYQRLSNGSWLSRESMTLNT